MAFVCRQLGATATSHVALAPLTLALVPGVLRVQHAAYDEDLHEPAESYADKLAASPGTSFVALHIPPSASVHVANGADTARDEQVVGYVVALAVPRFFVPALGSTSTSQHLAGVGTSSGAGDAAISRASAEGAVVDTLYLHDVAVDPAWRGCHIASHLLHAAERKRADMGLSRMALIAVRGADRFWKKVGFAPIPRHTLPTAVQTKLNGYGDEAVYMEKGSGEATEQKAVAHGASL